MVFVFEISNVFFNVVNWVVKTFYIIFFSNRRCSKSSFLFSSGADGYNLSVLCSIYTSINYTNLPGYNPLPLWWKLITSGNDDKAAFGFLFAAAVALFEVNSKTLPGFFFTLAAIFSQALAEVLPWFLKKTT